jgi:response regulator RpfG family c-di-GMP phosphodiesterase
MDGFEATRRLRISPDLAGVVAIAISASVFDFDRQQSRKVGCDDFLSKPVREAELLEKLRLHLGLEWIYEEKAEVGRIKDENTSLHTSSFTVQTSIVAPPAEEVAILFDLAMRGDLRGIVDRAAKLEALDRQWVPFATHLRQLAKGFKGKQILEFLKQYQGHQ